MRRVLLFAASVLVSLSCAAPASADPATRCQRRKRVAVQTFTSQYLGCHASAARNGGAPSSACLGKATTALSSAYAVIDETSYDCTTRGEMPAFAATARALLDLVAETAAPTSGASQCSAQRLIAAAGLVGRTLTGRPLRRKGDGDRAAERVRRRNEEARRRLSETDANEDCPVNFDRDALLWVGERVAGHLASMLADCQPVSGPTLLAHAEGVLSDRLRQARTLGYTEVLDADLCPGPGRLARGARLLYAGAILKSPANGDVLFLRHSSPDASSHLLKVGPTASVSLFGESGGIALWTDGSIRAVGPDGRMLDDSAAAAASPRATKAGGCARMTDELLSCIQPYCRQNPDWCASSVMACSAGAFLGLADAVFDTYNPPKAILTGILKNLIAEEVTDGACQLALGDLFRRSGCADPAGDRCVPEPQRVCQAREGTCDSTGACIPDPDTANPIGARCRPGESSVGQGSFPLPFCTHADSPFQVDEAAYNGRCVLDSQGAYPVCKLQHTPCASDQTCHVQNDPVGFPIARCDSQEGHGFAISGVAYRSSLAAQESSDARIAYRGAPVFPVRTIVRVEQCSVDADCTSTNGIVFDPVRPIVAEDFLRCDVSGSQSITGTFSLRLQDAEGTETPPHRITLTCAGVTSTSHARSVQPSGMHIGQ